MSQRPFPVRRLAVRGLSLLIAWGGMLRDVVASMSTPVMGYIAVYALEVVLLIATIVAMVPLLRRNPPPLSA